MPDFFFFLILVCFFVFLTFMIWLHANCPWEDVVELSVNRDIYITGLKLLFYRASTFYDADILSFLPAEYIFRYWPKVIFIWWCCLWHHALISEPHMRNQFTVKSSIWRKLVGEIAVLVARWACCFAWLFRLIHIFF